MAENSSEAFQTTDYRILQIQIEDGNARVSTIYKLGEKREGRPVHLRSGEAFRLRVGYECLMDELPEESCGIAAALTRASDKEQIMYFNTNYPHSDDEILTYNDAPFRTYIGRIGEVEGTIRRLQIKPDTYLLSLGILPNKQTHHEFYEFHYLEYTLIVEDGAEEIKGDFCPLVSATYEHVDAGAEISATMTQAGVNALFQYVPSSVAETPDEIVKAIFEAMSAARPSA